MRAETRAKTAGRAKRRDPYAVSAGTGAAIHIFFGLFAAACVLPVSLVLIVSFTDNSSFILYGYSFFPSKMSVFAYRFLLGDFGVMARAYGVSALICVLGAGMQVISQSLFAYPLSRRDFPFSKFFSTFILITMLFSGGIAPFYYIYVRILHVKNSVWAMIFPLLGGGYNIFMYRMFFRLNVPSELIEASKIDGASEARIYAQIILPLSLPVLATFSLFGVIAYWNDFFNCLLFVDNQKIFNIQFVMQRALRSLTYIQSNIKYMGGASSEMQKVAAQLPAETLRMAMAVFGMGPIVIAYPFFQRYFVKGLVVGAIKG